MPPSFPRRPLPSPGAGSADRLSPGTGSAPGTVRYAPTSHAWVAGVLALALAGCSGGARLDARRQPGVAPVLVPESSGPGGPTTGLADLPVATGVRPGPGAPPGFVPRVVSVTRYDAQGRRIEGPELAGGAPGVPMAPTAAAAPVAVDPDAPTPAIEAGPFPELAAGLADSGAQPLPMCGISVSVVSGPGVPMDGPDSLTVPVIPMGITEMPTLGELPPPPNPDPLPDPASPEGRVALAPVSDVPAEAGGDPDAAPVAPTVAPSPEAGREQPLPPPPDGTSPGDPDAVPGTPPAPPATAHPEAPAAPGDPDAAPTAPAAGAPPEPAPPPVTHWPEPPPMPTEAPLPVAPPTVPEPGAPVLPPVLPEPTPPAAPPGSETPRFAPPEEGTPPPAPSATSPEEPHAPAPEVPGSPDAAPVPATSAGTPGQPDAELRFTPPRERRVLEHVRALKANPDDVSFPCWPSDMVRTAPASTAFAKGDRPVLVVFYDDGARASRLAAADLWPVVLALEARIDFVPVDLTPGAKRGLTDDERRLFRKYYLGYVPTTVVLSPERSLRLLKSERVDPALVRAAIEEATARPGGTR